MPAILTPNPAPHPETACGAKSGDTGKQSPWNG